MAKYPNWLTGRCFGGSFVADTPGNDESAGGWPDGRCAPGAQECCEYLLEFCNSPRSSNLPVFVFLVGGAGNGKSYLAKKVTNQLLGCRIDEKGTFASRIYDYQLDNGSKLHVVNDATIPPKYESGDRDYLLRDISGALHEGSSMLVCVNRGILVSESNVLIEESDETRSLASRLVRWLLNGKVESTTTDNGALHLDVSNSSDNGAHYAFCSIKRSEKVIAEVHVAFMDQCSLFEPFPTSSVNAGNEKGPILVPEVQTLAPISDSSREEADLPGKEALAALYQRVAQEISGTSSAEGELDPVVANLGGLSDPKVLHGVCNILRAAEIITGNQINYRDLWGISVIALLGAIPSGGLEEYETWVVEQTEAAKGQSATDQLRAIVCLAMRRTHMSMFSAFGPAFLLKDLEQPTYPKVQALECITHADPLVCLSEDVLRTIKEKLTLLDEEEGPGEALAQEDELFAKAWTVLDQRLEQAILNWLSEDDGGPTFSQRNELLAWYGQYLARLYALVNGKPAYESLANEWQETWLRASRGSSKPTRELSDGLNRLLFTPFEENRDDTYLPVFSSRVTPVTSGDDGKKVAIRVPYREYHWEHRVLGSSIIMELKKYTLGNQPVTEFILDFLMLRETAAQRDGSGFTEASIDVEPRIERVRAGILAAEMLQARQGDARPEVVFVDGSTPIL